MENDWKKRLGVVYSTDPDYQYQKDDEPDRPPLPPGEQRLYVRADRKQRKGKTVTLVEGFEGSGDDLRSLGKELKTRCGAGGAVKDGKILVQGDFRQRITEILEKMGYRVKRSGG